MSKSTIKVTSIRVKSDPETQVFQLEILTPAENSPGSAWNETFNTEDQLNRFLRGIRVATSMALGTFNMAEYWEFDKDSLVKELP
jgi:hypothetical protein